MNKKKYFKYKFYCNSAYYASLIAALVIGVIIGQRFPKHTNATKSQEPAPRATVQQIDTVIPVEQTAPKINHPTVDNGITILHHRIDSLRAANVAMFDSVAEEYIAHLDSQYTLGRFFGKTEIAQLNTLVGRYLQSDALNPTGDTLLNVASQIMPLTARTPLVTFESVVYLANIPQQTLDRFGVVFDSEHIDHFTNATRQKTFQKYLDAYSNTFVGEDEPNFQISEFASIQQKYNANKRQISELQNQIQKKSEH